MTPFQDEFDVTGIDQALASRLLAVKNRCLRDISLAGYNVLVSRESGLDDIGALWTRYRDIPDAGMTETPFFDRRLWPNANRSNTLILFMQHQKTGDIVGCVGSRIVELFDRARMAPLSLREAIEDGHFFALDPAMDRERGECRSHALEQIRDCMVCIAGGLWQHPHHRGHGAVKSFLDLGRIAVAAARDFRFSWVVSMFAEPKLGLALDYYDPPVMAPREVKWRGTHWWVATWSRLDFLEDALSE
jgi:hypothetical protein